MSHLPPLNTIINALITQRFASLSMTHYLTILLSLISPFQMITTSSLFTPITTHHCLSLLITAHHSPPPTPSPITPTTTCYFILPPITSYYHLSPFLVVTIIDIKMCWVYISFSMYFLFTRLSYGTPS